MPQEGSSVFSLFSLIKLHWPPSHRLVATVVWLFHQYFGHKIYIFRPKRVGPPLTTKILKKNQNASRALSLRNLVSEYECGRVFPAGVGPDSPSRDAANWLPSRFSLSVETRRRYGWLRMMVFPGARLFQAPIWCPSGGWRHARGREHCRGEPGSSLSGGYVPDSAKAEGSSIVDELGEG